MKTRVSLKYFVTDCNCRLKDLARQQSKKKPFSDKDLFK